MESLVQITEHNAPWGPTLKTRLNTVTVRMMIIVIITVAPFSKDRVEHCDSDDYDH